MLEIFLQIIFPLVFAIIVVSVVQPRLVRIALMKSIVDKPNARKLNKTPVPVLGGVGVFLGILLTVSLFSYLNGAEPSFVIFAASTLVLYLGVIDDILNIKAVFKFMVQILAVAMLIWIGGFGLDSLHGLWGVYGFSCWFSIPLTLVAGVGIINALNLIDGVDGLSSGYGIMTAVICGIVFSIAGNAAFTVLSFAIAGSLLPFFVHNCFGRKYKMYIGDGGSLMLGLLFAVIVMQFVGGDTQLPMKGVVSFVIALLSLPVFDTIRVMCGRIFHGRSPFSADKTHLHHLFIDMGYSHPATTLILLSMDLIVVGVWFAMEYIDAISVDMQFYILMIVAALAYWGVYFIIASYRRRNPDGYSKMQECVSSRQIRRQGIFKTIQRFLDKC